MAKFGEGDERWIVEERSDGANVHNWHWAEKDVTLWAEIRLKELLGNALPTALTKEVMVVLKKIEVSGEATINNRKNKLIPAYELAIKSEWMGTLLTIDGISEKASGTFEIPYLADENADENPEVSFKVEKDNSACRKCKEALDKHGKEIIYKSIQQFVKEMQEGGPNKRASTEPCKIVEKTSHITSTASKSASIPKTTTSYSKIELNEKFYAKVQDIFECFTDENKIKAFTQSFAKVEPVKGGCFNIFGGSISGKILDIVQDTKIILEWRFQNWKEGDISLVHLSFSEPEVGTTIVKLCHEKIPVEDKFDNSDVLETTTVGWKQQIFYRIRAVFGYGLGL